MKTALSPFTLELGKKMLLVRMTYVIFTVNKYTMFIYIYNMHNNNTSSLYMVLFFPGTKNDPWLLLSHLS